jgi:hypothetical protein
MSGFLDPKPLTVAGLDNAVSGKITTPGSAVATALNATYALKTDVLPTTLDGGNATSTYTGTFNFDGGSAT